MEAQRSPLVSRAAAISRSLADRIALTYLSIAKPEAPIKSLLSDHDFDRDAAIQDLIEESESTAHVWRTTTELIPDNTGGVNFGDRRALYSLIRHFRPARVLEIGTHVGASTAIIAQALRQNDSEGSPGHLWTVDIRDVNLDTEKPWLEYGCKLSPMEMLRRLGLETTVDFVAMPSVEFMQSSNEPFDLIFLDGDHSASAVYREIPLALKILNPSGVIILHDYFPACKPLWSNGVVIRGPFLAVERLAKRGLDVKALPLGSLPWPTKLGSSVTSLAVLLRCGSDGNKDVS